MSGELALVVGRYLPFLRRYARALCGDQVAGDRLVRAEFRSAFLARGPSD